MLDVLDFISDREGNPERIRLNQSRRYAPESLVNDVIRLFQDHRRTQYEATQFGSQINKIQSDITATKKAKGDATELVRAKIALQDRKKAQEEQASYKLTILNRTLRRVGNYVHQSVPTSDDEKDNCVLRSWSPATESTLPDPRLSHHEILAKLGGYDPERGVKIAGHRAYCLTNYGLFLNLALINYGLDFLFQRGYTPNQPPFFMSRDAMAKTAQLEQFDEELYRVVEDENRESDKYLIATSEQPLSAIHQGEWLSEKQLPIKYAGYSTCFRKEAGAHGKDAWGIYRVHQFEKVEQLIICKPEESWTYFDKMIEVSEDFYKSLEIPYQVVSIVSGALNNAASKKYDLEAWFPHQNEYKELVSCSNCTDYQTRELEIRYGAKKQTDARKEYVHALNSTLCATERTLCCILENHQKADGLHVPSILRKYIPGSPEFLPYLPLKP